VRLEFCHYHQAGKPKISLQYVVLNPRLVRLRRIFRNYLGNMTIFGYIRLAKIVGSRTSRREAKKLQMKLTMTCNRNEEQNNVRNNAELKTKMNEEELEDL
jgi:hypothetical protein